MCERASERFDSSKSPSARRAPIHSERSVGPTSDRTDFSEEPGSQLWGSGYLPLE